MSESIPDSDTERRIGGGSLLRVTRRGVLAIAGSALSAPAIASDGLSEPPTVNLEAGDLTIGLGKSRWTLSPQAFSGIPSVPLPTLSLKTEFTQPNDTPRWTASLSDAVLPGTTIRFDLSLLIGHDDVANYWYVTATLNGRVSRKLHLPDFLGAEAVFEFAPGAVALSSRIGAATLTIERESVVRVEPGPGSTGVRITVVPTPSGTVAELGITTPAGHGYQCVLHDITLEPTASPEGPLLTLKCAACSLPEMCLGRVSCGTNAVPFRVILEADATPATKLTIQSRDEGKSTAGRKRIADLQIEAPEAGISFRSTADVLRLRFKTLQLAATSAESRSKEDMSHQVVISGCLLGQLIETRTMAFRVAPTSCGVADFKQTITGCRNDLHFNVGLLNAYVPVRGASFAELDFYGHTAAIHIGCVRGEGDKGPSLFIGEGERFVAPLDDAALALKRSADLFDLRFEFRRYSLECVNGTTTTTRHSQSGCARPVVVAIFPPQHLQEAVGTADATSLKLPCRPVKTQLSGPTRIAMETGCDEPEEARPTVLTIEKIMDWHDLAAVVHDRALPADAPIDSQLKAVGLGRATERWIAQAQWHAAMTSFPASNGASDCDWGLLTQIEPVTGLIVSPDASVVFRATPEPLNLTRNPLWRLGFTSAGTRVIHSRGTTLPFMRPKLFAEGTTSRCDSIATEPSITPFPASLTQRDRDELLVLTSGFGLPSLRRLQKKNDGTFGDDPHGSVVLPENADTYAFLSTKSETYSGATVRQEGLFIPKPFSTFEMSLTALKGSLNAVWHGEPPAPLSAGIEEKQIFYAEALAIEGYEHRVAYGRDVLCQVTYKGFLAPIGCRCACIKTTERVFVTEDRLPKGEKDPIAYLIQSVALVTQKPRKLFPALNQPLVGRNIPVSSFDLITIRTSNIVDVDEIDTQLLKLGAQSTENAKGGLCGNVLKGRVFWPRSSPGEVTHGDNQYGNEVIFEYRLDDSPATVKSRLLFVDNTAAHDPDTMKRLVEYYNNLSTSEDLKYLAIAEHGGAARKYAPSLDGGETSFSTEKWMLGMEGRDSNTGAEELPAEDPRRRVLELRPYTMDALMEGADQPPFYPTMNTALIRMQSLDRMLGTPQGLITTRLSPLYRNHAFDTSGNPAEIYLEVISPAIDLNLAGNGGSSGGVAQPNSRLAAVSRKKGMVGGRPLDSATRAGARLAANATTDQPLCDFSATASGRFDPVEFLGGGLGDALLLGIVPLKEVVRAGLIAAGPQLKEVEAFSEDVLEKVNTLAGPLILKLEDVRRNANQAIAAALNIVSPGDELASLYPDIARRYDDVLAVLKRIVELNAKQPMETGAILRELGRLMASAKGLIAAAEATAGNPLPEGIKDLREKVEFIWQTLKELRDPAQASSAIKNLVVAPIYDRLIECLNDALCQPLLKQLFGTASIDQIIANPLDAFAQAPHTPLTEAYAKPLVNALAPVVQMMSVVDKNINWPSEGIRRRFIASICGGNSEFLRRICGADLADGSDPTVQVALIRISDSVKLLSDPFSDSSVRRKILSAEAILNALKSDSSFVVKEACKRLFEAVWPASPVAGRPSFPVTKDVVVGVAESACALLKRAADKVHETLNQYVGDIPANRDNWTAIQREEWTLRVQSLHGPIQSLVEEGRSLSGAILGTGRPMPLAARLATPGTDSAVSGVQASLDDLGTELTDLRARCQQLTQQQLGDIRKKITEEIEAELAESLERLSTDLRTAVSHSIEDVGSRIMSVVRGVLDAYGILVQLLQVSFAVTKHPVADLSDFFSARFPEGGGATGKLPQMLKDLRTSIEKLGAISEGAVSNQAEAKASRIRGRAADVRRAVTHLADAVEVLTDDYKAVRSDFVPNKLPKTSESVSRFFCHQRVAVDACEEVLSSIATAVEAFADGPHALINELHPLKPVLEATKNIAMELLVVCKPEVVLDAGSDTIRNLGEKMTDDLKSAVSALLQFSTVADATPERVTFVCATLRSALCTAEEKYIGALSTCVEDISQACKAAERRLKEFVCVKLAGANDKGPLGPLVNLYDSLVSGIETVLVSVRGSVAESADPAIGNACAPVLKPMLDALARANAALKSDQTNWNRITGLVDKCDDEEFLKQAADALTQLPKATQDLGLVRATREIASLIESLFKGQLGSLVDFKALRDALEDQLLALLPTSFSQSYDWDTTIEDYPRKDSLFIIDRRPESAGLRPKRTKLIEGKEATTDVDLKLSATVDVDLRKKTRLARAEGHLAPFKIRLLGSSYDLVTIGFTGAQFSASTDGGTTFDVRIGDVVIGKQLEFLQKLQELFMPKGTGPYVALSLSPPAVEAGYRFCKPVVMLGSMSLQNIGVSVSMLLPFDQKPALFRFAFASRENPFLISVAPYGGGGFVGLIATARGIIGFEVQFEYGAVVAMTIDVLEGNARITAGIYLCSTTDDWVIEGFVQALGSGHIACFGISIAMIVKVRQEKGGDMTGSATYAFEFDVGLFTVGYSVTNTQVITSKDKSNAAFLASSEPKRERPSESRFRNWASYRQHLAMS